MRCRLNGLALSLCLVLLGSTAFSQDAGSGQAYSLKDLTKTALGAESTAERDEAFENLKQIFTFDPSAALALDTVLVERGGRENILQSLDFLHSAASQGNVAALRRLGDRYREGEEFGLDPKKSIAIYEEAASKADARAFSRLGEIYLAGKLVTADVPKGIALLEQALEMGDTSAAVRLGDVYRDKMEPKLDPRRAMDYYEMAAKAGDVRAFGRLGDSYRDGEVAKIDRVKADLQYRKAIELGDERARIKLAKLLLQGSNAQQKAGIKVLQSAIDRGDSDAVKLLAMAHMRGEGVPRDPAKALRILEDKAKSGDSLSALTLIQLQLTPAAKGGAGNVAGARLALRDYSPILPAEDIRTETLMLEFAAPFNAARVDALVAEFAALELEHKRAAVTRLRAININYYVAVMQDMMKRNRLYEGPISGQLSSASIVAFARMCRLQQKETECREGPLSYRARQVLQTVMQ